MKKPSCGRVVHAWITEKNDYEMMIVEKVDYRRRLMKVRPLLNDRCREDSLNEDERDCERDPLMCYIAIRRLNGMIVHTGLYGENAMNALTLASRSIKDCILTEHLWMYLPDGEVVYQAGGSREMQITDQSEWLSREIVESIHRLSETKMKQMLLSILLESREEFIKKFGEQDYSRLKGKPHNPFITSYIENLESRRRELMMESCKAESKAMVAHRDEDIVEEKKFDEMRLAYDIEAVELGEQIKEIHRNAEQDDYAS